MAVVLGLTPVLAAIPVRAAGGTTVLPSTAGWSTADTRANGHVNFVLDGTSPLGSGSLQLTTDGSPVSGQDKAQFLTTNHVGTKLSDVTTLAYWTKQDPAHTGFVAGLPSFQLEIDADGVIDPVNPGAGYTTMVYEPYNVFGNAVVQNNVWQQWDVDTGTFWSSRSVAELTPTKGGLQAGGGGAPFYSLQDLKDKFPNAVVLRIGVNIGSNNAAFNTYADGVVFNDTTYNFEPVISVTTKEDCKNGGWQKSNSPVFRNQGDCIHYVKENTHEVEGTLTLSNPNQKIKFRDEEKGWWHRSKHGPSVEYWNYEYPGGLHYKADVMCTSLGATKKEARVMFQIPDGYPGLSGLYIVSYVKEGKGKTKAMYGHAATADVNVARQWCETGQGFSPSMYPVVRGDVEVH